MKLGYSFCPNDTFIFYAFSHGLIPFEPIETILEDVETLNSWAIKGKLELTKLSYHAFAHVSDKYIALRSGGALGRGVGPLIVAKNETDLTGKVIAIPGELTTANLLLKLFSPKTKTVEVRYDQIMPAVIKGEVDAGVIIHESRFTYANFGLKKVIDLGEWWEKQTNLPLPLGVILARRDLGQKVSKLNSAIRQSLEYAYKYPEETVAYIKNHAQELDDRVVQAHVDLYVNHFSLDIGLEGEKAVKKLFELAEPFIPKLKEPLFIDE